MSLKAEGKWGSHGRSRGAIADFQWVSSVRCMPPPWRGQRPQVQPGPAGKHSGYRDTDFFSE